TGYRPCSSHPAQECGGGARADARRRHGGRARGQRRRGAVPAPAATSPVAARASVTVTYIARDEDATSDRRARPAAARAPPAAVPLLRPRQESPMNSLILAVVGVAMMVAGYLLYSRYLGRRVYKLSASFRTPAHELADGVDYVPTNKFILWGHHFTSVAGAAPIVGPAVAVIWGW